MRHGDGTNYGATNKHTFDSRYYLTDNSGSSVSSDWAIQFRDPCGGYGDVNGPD